MRKSLRAQKVFFSFFFAQKVQDGEKYYSDIFKNLDVRCLTAFELQNLVNKSKMGLGLSAKTRAPKISKCKRQNIPPEG